MAVDVDVVVVDMMREGLRFAHQGDENKKPTWASGRYRLRERCLVRLPCGLRTSGVSPDPPWPLPARLAEPACGGPARS